MSNNSRTELIGKNYSGGVLNHTVQDINFLQSEEWRKFQESVGRKTFHISYPHPSPLPEEEGGFSFWANIIEHRLPIVGKYFYIPRGPIICHPERNSDFNRSGVEGSRDSSLMLKMTELINLAKKENAGWIRFDANNEGTLKIAKNNLLRHQMSKSPHDMQPREIFVIDITKPEEQLMAEMKAKTRYNIKLAEQKNVRVFAITNNQETRNKYLNEFLKLVKLTSKRQKIISHPESYYRKMFEVIPLENIKLYAAEYQNKVVAANIVIFYPVKSPPCGDGKAVFNRVNGDTATYLHGASDNEYRNVMAPYLLQWRAIQDAKKMGFIKYDMGGVKTKIFNFKFSTLPTGRQVSKQFPISNFQKFIQISKNIQNTKYQIPNTSWAGITKFKTGFSPNTQPVEFAGSYDVIINPVKYNIYRIIQKIKRFI